MLISEIVDGRLTIRSDKNVLVKRNADGTIYIVAVADDDETIEDYTETSITY